MKSEKCGIYQIQCRTTGKCYVGSSKQIYVRWSQHRSRLRRGKHTGVHLQRAWAKYGAEVFVFSVLEECGRDELEAREQHYIDLLEPDLNCVTDIKRHSSPELRAKIAAGIRAQAATITHCPHGHEYTEANTYRSKKSERICRACNALRVKAIYARETPEQREARRVRAAESHAANRTARLAAQREYNLAHKAEKRNYDIQYRERMKAQAS
jgi:group I intron endonuclease